MEILVTAANRASGSRVGEALLKNVPADQAVPSVKAA